MKDKDLEAFEKWLEIEFGEKVDKSRTWTYEKSIFRFACEYKQKEIEDLYKHLKHEHDLYRKHLKVYEDEILEYKEAARSEAEEVNRLQTENKKLREALEFTLYCAEYLIRPEKELSHELPPTSYLTLSYEGDLDLINKCKKARKALKEVEEL